MATANFGTPNYDLPIIVGDVEDSLDYFAAEPYIEEINDELKHFEVVAEAGYYEGFMLNAKQTDDYWDVEDIATITDDDAEYFYGDTAENIKHEFAEDMKKIKAFFERMKQGGMFELNKVAQFSNGEAVYKRVK